MIAQVVGIPTIQVGDLVSFHSSYFESWLQTLVVNKHLGMSHQMRKYWKFSLFHLSSFLSPCLLFSLQLSSHFPQISKYYREWGKHTHEKVMGREREREKYLFCWFTPRWPQWPGWPGWSQEPRTQFPAWVTGVQIFGQSLTAFPRSLVENWSGSGAAETQASTHMRCKQHWH